MNSIKLNKRLLTELKDFQQNHQTNYSYLQKLSPKFDDNLLIWSSFLFGSDNSIYKDHVLELTIEIPVDYPAKPPKISFKPNQIFHPNVAIKTGEICLDILKSEWSPIWTLTTVCLAIQTLLGYPESSSPLNVDAANLLRCGDTLGYQSLARMYLFLSEET